MFIKKMWNKWREPKPFNQGYLPIADGHEVWFSEYGNVHGEPILVTHGGPGGCCRASKALNFNLKKYRVIMFDQRGCGNSKPFGKLENNTTHDILFDIDRLLSYLKIEDKIIFSGGSWASTIALLYAQHRPDRVKKLILSQIFLADENNEKWITEQCSLFYPDKLEQLRKPLQDWQSISQYYFSQLTSDNIEQQKKALGTYACFERVLGSLSPHWRYVEEVDEIELGYARIYAQYDAYHYYIKNNEIIRNIKKIEHIPTLIVHNRLDMVCPLQGAYELSKKMKHCKLVIVSEKGHVGSLLHKTIASETKKFLMADN